MALGTYEALSQNSHGILMTAMQTDNHLSTPLLTLYALAVHPTEPLKTLSRHLYSQDNLKLNSYAYTAAQAHSSF